MFSPDQVYVHQESDRMAAVHAVGMVPTRKGKDFYHTDNRPQAVAQRKQQEKEERDPVQLKDNRPHTIVQRKQQEQLEKRTAPVQLQDNRPRSTVQQKQTVPNPVQRKANSTGLPDHLKSGIENLSGHSMDDVKVHYNSSQPAQLNAHAYAQGNQIHVAPGQEKHLPHEAWHVVQQKQGRVKPTQQLKSKVNINDNVGLEKEADAMGAKALQTKSTQIQLKEKEETKSNVAQLTRNPYGRDIDPFSRANLTILLMELIDFFTVGFFEDVSRLIRLENAHEASGQVQNSAVRRMGNWVRAVVHMGARGGMAYAILSALPPGMLGGYLTLLLTNLLNWFYERLISRMGERAIHGGGGVASRISLGYLRYAEGVETESVEYPVVRRSGRRTGADLGRVMGRSESVAGGRLSASQAAGSSVGYADDFEWGHRRPDSHRGTNTPDNLGSESAGANSMEMAGERHALTLNRANPGRVRRRNFALRYIGTLLDRSRNVTIYLDGIPQITEFVRSDRGRMTTSERSYQEDDYEHGRTILIQFNLRTAIIIPLIASIFFLILSYIF